MVIKEKSIFINCPYDKSYQKMLRRMVFILTIMGFDVCLASDNANQMKLRLETIAELVKDCKYSIHDISYMRAKKRKEYSRMNMPFELGIDYGYMSFCQNEKRILILEACRYDSHKALSDISGMDISCHSNKEYTLTCCIRDWVSALFNVQIPSSNAFWNLYFDFTSFVHELAKSPEIDENSIMNNINECKHYSKIFLSSLPYGKKELYSAFK